MNVILKLQWPIAGESDSPILAYDQNRRHQKLLTPTAELTALFDGRAKIYVEAQIVAGEVTVQREITERPW
jgi:hypothetical protein